MIERSKKRRRAQGIDLHLERKNFINQLLAAEGNRGWQNLSESFPARKAQTQQNRLRGLPETGAQANCYEYRYSS